MAQHKIFTADVLKRLAANGKATRAAQAADKPEPDHVPVVKIFNPYGAATWLLTEADPGEPDRLFGLCDLGEGYPELGYVSRSELEEVRVHPFGELIRLPLEREAYWTTDKPLSYWTEKAREAERITA